MPDRAVPCPTCGFLNPEFSQTCGQCGVVFARRHLTGPPFAGDSPNERSRPSRFFHALIDDRPLDVASSLKTLGLLGALVGLGSCLALAFASGMRVVGLFGALISIGLITSWRLGRESPDRTPVAFTRGGTLILVLVVLYVGLMWRAATGPLPSLRDSGEMIHPPGLLALLTAFGARLVHQGRSRTAITGRSIGKAGLVVGGIFDALVLLAMVVAFRRLSSHL